MQKIKKNPGILYFLAVYFIYVSFYLIFILLDELRRVIFHILPTELDIAIWSTVIVSFMIAITLVLLFIRVTGKKYLISIHSFKLNRKAFIWPVLFTIIVLIIKPLWINLYRQGVINPFQSPILDFIQTYYERLKYLFIAYFEGYSPLAYILVFLNLVIIGPLAEEILFRGIMLNGLMKRYPVWFAILFQAVLFSLYHFFYDPWRIVPGILFGIFVYYYRSIIPSLMGHMLWNLYYYIVRTTKPLKTILNDLPQVVQSMLPFVVVLATGGFVILVYHVVFRIIQKKNHYIPETISFRERIRGLFRRVPDGYFSPDGAE